MDVNRCEAFEKEPMSPTSTCSRVTFQLEKDLGSLPFQLDKDLGSLPPNSPRIPEMNVVKSSAFENSSRLSEFRSRVSLATRAASSTIDPLTSMVMVTGCTLAVCAGMVNAVAFRTLGSFVSHMTGAWAKVGLSAQTGAAVVARDAGLLVLSFMLGSMVCGCMIKRTLVKTGSAGYGLALILNAFVLVLAFACADEVVAPYLVALACGLQNGIASSYSGAAIRTTHYTGIVTDVGLILGRHVVAFFRRTFCRRTSTSDAEAGDVRKLILLVLLMASFFVGIVFGSVLSYEIGVHAFLVPAVVSGVGGLVYCAHRLRQEEGQSKDLSMRAPRWLSQSTTPQSPVHVEVFAAPALKDLPKTTKPPLPEEKDEALRFQKLLKTLDQIELELSLLPLGAVPGRLDPLEEALEAHRKLRAVLAQSASGYDGSGL
mmetsp:Transcript_26408/g.42320  ORF Transcript_26408/g.42320 Transcript_26408/m.42320 type:complete len:429 (+) Transcript_26408:86-1372(+)